MSVLNRREDDTTVPSLPSLPTSTGGFWSTPTAFTPPRNVFVCEPAVPILIVPDSPAAPAWLPMSMLLLPVVRLLPASLPSAMLSLPAVVAPSAFWPTAELLLPVALGPAGNGFI